MTTNGQTSGTNEKQGGVAGGGVVDRRDFLRSAAAAGVGVGLFGGASGLLSEAGVARAAWAGGSDTLKVGLVGCGGRGTGAALQALRADKGSVLWAMGDVFKDRLESSMNGLKEELKDEPSKLDVAESRKFTGFDCYKGVVDSGVDVVVLTSYPNFRPAHIRYALERGKHVFAEKPVAVDAAGIRSVYESGEMAKAKNLALCIGFCWRYHPGMRAVFEQINGGGIGDVVSVHTTYHAGTLPKRPRQEGWSDLEFQMRNWWHFTWISGDHIVEQAIHSVDRMAWAVGDRLPTRVTCLGGRQARSGPEHGNVYDHFAAIYEYENGIRAHHTCRQMEGCPADNTDYVYGTKGRAVVNGFNNVFRTFDYSGKQTFEYKGPGGDMYQIEHDELFKSIRDGKPINDCPRAVHSCLMGIQARMAAYTGQVVTWKQALESKEDLQPAELGWDKPAPEPVIAIPGKTKLV